MLLVRNPPANEETKTGWDSIPGLQRLPGGKIWKPTPVFLPGTEEEPGRPQSIVSQRVKHD